MLHKAIFSVALVALSLGSPGAEALATDRLPPRALARLGSQRFYHGPGVRCAVLSPDGRRVASAAGFPSYFRHVSGEDRDRYDRIIVLWDAATGERIRELRAPDGAVSHLAFSPDGGRLAAVSGRTLLVFEVETGKLLRSVGKLERSVARLQYSGDGKQLRVSGYEGVVSWDIGTGKQVRSWQPPAGPSAWVKPRELVADAVPSPDGKVIAWRLWLPPDYSKLPPGALPPPPFPPNPTVLVVTDAGNGKPLYRQEFTHGSSRSFTFAPDGRRFMVLDRQLSVRDTATGKELCALDAASAYQFALSPDGRHAVTADGASRVRLWDLRTRKPSHELCRGLDYVNSDPLATPQAFTADGKTLVLASLSTLRLFDTTTGKARGAGPGHRAAITPRFSADGRTLFTTCGEARCSWNLTPGKEPALLAHTPRNPWEGICGNQALAHGADGRLFVDSRNDRLWVRETATDRVRCQLDGSHWACFGLLSPDSTRVLVWHLALGGNKFEGIGLYDARTGKRTGEFQPVNYSAYPMFSPDSRFVAWSDRTHAVHLHDAVTGKVVRTLRSSRPLPKAVCNHGHLLFSPDGERLVVTTYLHDLFSGPKDVGKWNTLPTRVFDIPSGRELSRFYAIPEKGRGAGRFSCAALSPDGRLLAAVEEESGTIRLTELASGKVRAELNGHRHGVQGLAFAPDGQTLASGGQDNVVFLWDVTGARTAGRAKPTTEKDLAAWWAELAAEDAQRAGAAVAALLRASGRSVDFLAGRLRPARATDPKLLARLLADLDARTFQQREAASRELARLGERAEPALRQALREGPPLEVRRRIEGLLDRLERRPLSQETLQALRAIEVLEHLGTPEARRCLEALARGVAEARPTAEARAALGRLGKRR